ncbi:MAG: thiamine pyrophosphate-dependent enzyme [Candidatus Paceibacterota bacterium]
MFRRLCFARYFELKVAEAYKEGLIYSPIYLSIGQESIAAALSTIIPGYYIFAQHRCHSTYLAFGGDPVKLIDELFGRPSGCVGGKGGSPMIQDPNIRMIGHHGLIGENVPLGVGFALGSNQNTVCFFGDAAAEEDYALGAMGFASTHKLPILFVCEDNGLSILTPTKVRRNWEIADVAKALKLPAIDITDDPWLIAYHAEELGKNLPALINCRTCRHFWHAGVGIDSSPEWDRLALVKKELKRLGIHFEETENQTKKYIDELWGKQLQKQ